MRTLYFILLIFTLSYSTQAQTVKKTTWFEEARYGMFIHWGLYSAAEGLWKGENLRYLNNYAEWIQYRNRIGSQEYAKLANRLVWEDINPEEWVIQAKKAGMKYIIMTSKHHDGVAIWDTKIGNYSINKLAGVNRDIIKELADACRKHNMKLGFYYSHWIDWQHPYAWDHNQEIIGRVSDEQFDQYWQQKVIPQLTELLTNYGDIAIMWFDMWIPYEKTIFKREQLEQAVSLIRKLQPNCLINSRLGLPTDAKYVDFETLGDNTFSTTYIQHPWETPGTIAHSWGYNGQEKEWKSTSQIFESLIANVSLNGGLTLNIGPRADGSIPLECQNRLNEVGEWLNKHSESIYGTTGLKFQLKQFDWGYLTAKGIDSQNPKIYAQIFNWPLDNILRLTGIKNNPTKITYKSSNGELNLKFDKINEYTLHVILPKNPNNEIVYPIEINYDGAIQTNRELVSESTFGGYALHANNLINSTQLDIIPYDGKMPAHVITSKENIKWKVELPLSAQDYKISLSAHNPSRKDVKIEIKIGKSTVAGILKPDGKVVVEPNENNYTDEFTDRNLGIVHINEKGILPVDFSVLGNEKILLNRIWIEELK